MALKVSIASCVFVLLSFLVLLCVELRQFQLSSDTDASRKYRLCLCVACLLYGAESFFLLLESHAVHPSDSTDISIEDETSGLSITFYIFDVAALFLTCFLFWRFGSENVNALYRLKRKNHSASQPKYLQLFWTCFTIFLAFLYLLFIIISLATGSMTLFPTYGLTFGVLVALCELYFAYCLFYLRVPALHEIEASSAASATSSAPNSAAPSASPGATADTGAPSAHTVTASGASQTTISVEIPPHNSSKTSKTSKKNANKSSKPKNASKSETNGSSEKNAKTGNNGSGRSVLLLARQTGQATNSSSNSILSPQSRKKLAQAMQQKKRFDAIAVTIFCAVVLALIILFNTSLDPKEAKYYEKGNIWYHAPYRSDLSFLVRFALMFVVLAQSTIQMWQFPEIKIAHIKRHNSKKSRTNSLRNPKGPKSPGAKTPPVAKIPVSDDENDVNTSRDDTNTPSKNSQNSANRTKSNNNNTNLAKPKSNKNLQNKHKQLVRDSSNNPNNPDTPESPNEANANTNNNKKPGSRASRSSTARRVEFDLSPQGAKTQQGKQGQQGQQHLNTGHKDSLSSTHTRTQSPKSSHNKNKTLDDIDNDLGDMLHYAPMSGGLHVSSVGSQESPHTAGSGLTMGSSGPRTPDTGTNAFEDVLNVVHGTHGAARLMVRDEDPDADGDEEPSIMMLSDAGPKTSLRPYNSSTYQPSYQQSMELSHTGTVATYLSQAPPSMALEELKEDKDIERLEFMLVAPELETQTETNRNTLKNMGARDAPLEAIVGASDTADVGNFNYQEAIKRRDAGGTNLNVHDVTMDGKRVGNYGRGLVPKTNMNAEQKQEALESYFEAEMFDEAPVLRAMQEQVSDPSIGTGGRTVEKLDDLNGVTMSSKGLRVGHIINESMGTSLGSRQSYSVADEPVSLIIYELDHVLSTLPNKINVFEQEYTRTSAKSVDKLVKQWGGSKFLLMFGGAERCIDLSGHLSRVLVNSGRPELNTKCFVFSARPTKFTITLLQQIGVNAFFKSKATLGGKKTDLSHVIGSDHALMRGNENKEHLIVLKLIYHFKKEHSNVLYVGSRPEVIKHLNQMQMCNTYHVKSKGMLKKDMKQIEQRFLLSELSESEHE